MPVEVSRAMVRVSRHVKLRRFGMHKNELSAKLKEIGDISVQR